MGDLYIHLKKILNKNQSISIKLRINYAYLNVVFMLYSVGFYGFPAISTDFSSINGLIFRILQYTLIILAFIVWFVSILKQSENYGNYTHHNTVKISLKHLFGTLLIFISIVISRQRELSSSITGDEIAFYDKSISISKFLLKTIILNNSALQISPARIFIGISQLILICIFLILVKFMLKFESKNKLYILFVIVIVLHSVRNYYMGGSSLYPEIETLPYFLTSPLLLFTGISPKYIAAIMLSIFLQVIYQLTKKTIKQKSLRIVLMTILISLNILTDIATTLNHGIYYIYVFTIFLIIFDREKHISRTMIFPLLTFSIYRPTLIILFIFLLAHVVLKSGNYRKLNRLISDNISKLQIFIPQYAIISILMFSNLVYSHKDPKSKLSLNDNLDLWVKNFSNLDFQTTLYIIVGCIFLIASRRYSVISLFFLSFVFYWLTAPRGNLSNPIYKVETLTPFLILSTIVILSRVSKLLSKIKNNQKLLYGATGPIALALCLLLVQLSEDNYKLTEFPNHSWNPEYNSAQSQVSTTSDSSINPKYISFAKIDYKLEALNLVLQNNCKFLDITYSGSFLLKTNISAREFIDLSENLTVDSAILAVDPSINCVFIGNYPYEKFENLNRFLNLGFVLSKAYYNEKLGTALIMYVRNEDD